MNDANEAQSALYAALASAIGETEGVAKHGSGQGYMYAKAEAVMREADRVLTKHGISVAPIGATLTVAGVAESPKGARTIFTLTCQFLVAHRAGGSFIGEMTIAVGTNLNATPPQATSSAYTCCERDFYRALLRMPRSDKDDVEHESHRRVEREEREPEPAHRRPARRSQGDARPRRDRRGEVGRRVGQGPRGLGRERPRAPDAG